MVWLSTMLALTSIIIFSRAHTFHWIATATSSTDAHKRQIYFIYNISGILFYPITIIIKFSILFFLFLQFLLRKSSGQRAKKRKIEKEIESKKFANKVKEKKFKQVQQKSAQK